MKITLESMRMKRQMSQAELSRRSTVPQPMISQIETEDVKNPTVGTLYKLATALKCTVDDLIEEERA